MTDVDLPASGVTLKRVLTLRYLVMFGLAYLAPTVVFDYYGIVPGLTGGMMALAYLVTLVAHYAAKTTTLALLAAVADRLTSVTGSDVTVWLVYDGTHDRAGVDHVIARAAADHGLDVQAVLMT